MSQRITNVCDAHTLFDNQDVAGEQVRTVTRDYGDGPRVLEICGCEDDRTGKQLKQLYQEMGRDPEPVRRGRPKGSGKGKALARDEYKCRFCRDIKDTPQGRGMHEFRSHPWQRLLWEEETNYRETHPQLEQKHIRTRQRRFELLEQMGVSLQHAADLEKRYSAEQNLSFEDASIDSSANRLRLAMQREEQEREQRRQQYQQNQSEVTVTTP